MWVISIPESMSKTGGRHRIFRATKKECERAASVWLGEYQEHGKALASLTTPERTLILRWRGKLTVDEMDEACSRAHEAGLITAAKAVERYLSAPREQPLDPKHLRSMRARLGRFIASSKSGAPEIDAEGKPIDTTRPLYELTAGELEDFIRAQQGSAPQMFANIKALFRYAHRQEWIKRNPFEQLEKPEALSAEKRILTPEQMRACLRIAAGVDVGMIRTSDPHKTTRAQGEEPPKGKWQAARHDPLLRALILGGLCGLRHSETMRLQCEEIDLKKGEIHIAGMKTQRSGIAERYAAMEPSATAWLKWCDLPAAGPVITIREENLFDARAHLVECGAVSPAWPPNALRRSFGSYHLAARQDAAKTAEIMGHTDASTTKSKYRVPRRKEIALEWFALTPEAVLALTAGESPATSAR